MNCTLLSTQAVADAYYVLSDPQRRIDYDRLSSSKSSSERTSDPNASSTFFSMFSGMFAGSGGDGQSGTAPDQSGQRPDADHVFGTVFEDVCFLPTPPAFLHAKTAYLLFFLPFAAASTARGRAASPIVVLARLSMWCRSGLYHRERAWPRRWRICGESTRGHSGRKGQECGRRLFRVGRHTESGGTLTTSSLLFSTTYFDYALPTGLARARLEGFRFSLYLTWCF